MKGFGVMYDTLWHKDGTHIPYNEYSRYGTCPPKDLGYRETRIEPHGEVARKKRQLPLAEIRNQPTMIHLLQAMQDSASGNGGK